jgi:tRNA U55 pseudouridine synthase TruB
MSEEERLSSVFDIEYVFRNYPSVTLADFFSRLAHSGLEIYLKKINAVFALGEKIRLYDKDGFFALGEVREFDGGLAIKPIRQF